MRGGKCSGVPAGWILAAEATESPWGLSPLTSSSEWSKWSHAWSLVHRDRPSEGTSHSGTLREASCSAWVGHLWVSRRRLNLIKRQKLSYLWTFVISRSWITWKTLWWH
jgi:hypothetical protein